MIILSNITMMAPGNSTALSVQGGTGPYTWSVVAGGAGGTVNSSGLYTSPNVQGVDVVRVVDSLAAVATFSIATVSHLKLLCDIINKELALEPDHIFIWNQRLPTLKDDKLYVAVAVLLPKAFGSSSHQNSDGSVTQSVNFHTMVSIDIMSRTTEALERKEEVVMALSSTYAEQQQEANSFAIGKLPTAITPIPGEEGAGIPYRFNFSVSLQYVATKIKASPYFDDFSDVAVTTES